VQSVKSKVVEPGYAWLRMTQFQEPTVDDMSKKLAAIYAQEPNLKGMVLDLRNDPGGVLPGAIGVAAAFLPKDSVVVSTNGQLPSSKQTFYAARVLRCQPAVGSAVAPAGRHQEGADGGAGQQRLGLGLRNRGRCPAGLQARHHHGYAVLRQGFGADRDRLPPEKNTAVKLTTARYYTPKAVPSRRAASCRTSWWTKPGWRWPERPAPA
jgi:carboxyl-terminal processing protease